MGSLLLLCVLTVSDIPGELKYAVSDPSKVVGGRIPGELQYTARVAAPPVAEVKKPTPAPAPVKKPAVKSGFQSFKAPAVRINGRYPPTRQDAIDHLLDPYQAHAAKLPIGFSPAHLRTDELIRIHDYFHSGVYGTWRMEQRCSGGVCKIVPVPNL